MMIFEILPKKFLKGCPSKKVIRQQNFTVSENAAHLQRAPIQAVTGQLVFQTLTRLHRLSLRWRVNTSTVHSSNAKV